MVSLFAAFFLAGTFVASPELRAFAANTVGSIDIIDGAIQSVDIGNGQVRTVDIGGNAVTSAKIKDGEVKAADIGTDSVGARQILGVDKLLYGKCNPSMDLSPNEIDTFSCSVLGTSAGDSVLATLTGPSCFMVTQATPTPGAVSVSIMSTCNSTVLGNFPISIVVFSK